MKTTNHFKPATIVKNCEKCGDKFTAWVVFNAPESPYKWCSYKCQGEDQAEKSKRLAQ